MKVYISKLSLAVGKDELTTLKLSKVKTASLKRSQRSNLKRPGVVCTTAMASLHCVCVFNMCKHTHPPTHTPIVASVPVFAFFPFLFQQGEFLSKCKAGDRCSSFL